MIFTLRLLLFGAFTAAPLFLKTHHEMWRDELQAWVIAVHSPGFSDLMTNTAYEDHPKLRSGGRPNTPANL